MAKKIAENEYNADSLIAQEFPANIRHNPWMLGGRGPEARFRAVKEVTDNAVDEAMAGFGDRITIRYDSKTCIVTVIDEGRGVPMGLNKEKGKYGAEMVFATLHSSGKFNAKAYKGGVIGVHGVGAACTNAVSEFLQVWACSNGKWLTQRFERGIVQGPPVKENPPSKQAVAAGRGSVVRFKLDSEIFPEGISLDAENMINELRSVAALNAGLMIRVIIDNVVTELFSENGIVDLIVTEESKSQIIGKPFTTQVDGLLDLALCWYDDDSTDGTFSFVNASRTGQDGKHVDGARAAIVEVLRAEIGEKDKIDVKYLTYGLRMALNYRTEKPNYAGQTKDRLTNTEAVSDVRKAMLASFTEYVKKNKQFVTALINRAKRFQKNAEKFMAENKAVKSLELRDPGHSILPGKLDPAMSCYKPDERELILVEGDSASTGCKVSKMPWQEILPLRGKFSNPAKTRFADLIKNEEVRAIFTCMGTLPNEPYDGKKRRVGRIGLLPDADHDGYHICALCVTLLAMYAPEWITGGHVFWINAPLFIGAYKTEKHYGNKRDEMLAQFPEKIRKNVIVTRLKGWSEAAVSDLHDIAMNPESRSITMVTMQDVDKDLIQKIMGDDVKYRKELLGIEEALA